LCAFTGTHRLLRFSLQAAIRVVGALPLQWRFQAYSPSLEQTGSWQEVAATLAARAEGNIYREYEVTKVEKESTNISSFYLAPKGEQSIPCHTAGQFLPLELHPLGIDGIETDKPLLRTYTISSAPNGSSYRLSIKREPAVKPGLPPGIASNYFHDHVTQGTTLRAMSPRGKFSLDTSSTRPIVLLSAGVRITPMISMLDQLIKQAVTCGGQRQIWFIHGARSGAEHAFADHVRGLAETCESLQVHIRCSRPTQSDQAGRDYDSQGHVDMDLLKSLLPFDDYDFYMCGPAPFIEALHSGLRALNISDERTHYEFFGQGSSLQRQRPSGADAQTTPANSGPVAVRFARSGISAVWDPSKGSLLDLAEAEGLRPNYSCRSGICQTCSTNIVSGRVEYLEPPMAAPKEGDVLICCSYPRPQPAGSEDDEGIILDL
jgi:ferredoxin-NADP reductase